VDYTSGSVLHVRGYSSRGHAPKNKYVLIIGQKSDSEVLGFLISSQLTYLTRESHKKEVIRVPHNATTFLKSESIIQCFEMERLSVTALCEGFADGSITHEGKIPIKYLHRIREVVSDSFLLVQRDIDDVLKLLPKAK
jgi:hypothetical protein